MKCVRCIIEGLPFGLKDAVTVYKGTALCIKHVIEAELADRREMTLPPVAPKKAKGDHVQR
jgi:hypothetical protein